MLEISSRLRRFLATASLIGFGLLPALPATAQQTQLQRAISAYRAKDYAQARDTLSTLLDRRMLDVRAERITARTYLAACHYALGEMDLARSRLRELFSDDPAAPVDPKLFSGIRPTFIELAEEIRTDVAREHGDRPMRPVTSEVAAPVSETEAPVRRGPASLAFSFVPFGVGQFANGQSTKGALFLTSEGVAFLTAGVALALFESKKAPGSPGLLQGGYFTQGDSSAAYTLETTYLVAFWGGVAIAVVGVIDALFNRPEVKLNVVAGPGSVYVRF